MYVYLKSVLLVSFEWDEKKKKREKLRGKESEDSFRSKRSRKRESKDSFSWRENRGSEVVAHLLSYLLPPDR